MVNVPLIQGNSIQEINTSIIAIKKAQKELEALNTLVDNKIKALNLALNGGPGKFIQSISQTGGQVAVEVGELTDTIASGNTQPATSNGVAGAISTEATARDNAIASAFGQWETLGSDGTPGGNEWVLEAIETQNGKYVHFYCQNMTFKRGQILCTVPQKYRLTNHIVARCYFYQSGGLNSFINLQDYALIYPSTPSEACYGDFITKID